MEVVPKTSRAFTWRRSGIGGLTRQWKELESARPAGLVESGRPGGEVPRYRHPGPVDDGRVVEARRPNWT